MDEDKAGENAKLQQHLSLLRSEFSKLQSRYRDLERRHELLLASSSTSDGNKGDSFAVKILKFVSELHASDNYSDVKIQLETGEEKPAHKFVLSARTRVWSDIQGRTLDWKHLEAKTAETLLKWIYSDRLEIDANISEDRKEKEHFLLTLMRTANAFQLSELLGLCEDTLMGSVDVSNCIVFYATADEIGSEGLKEHCSQLISTHWDSFNTEDFEVMAAPLLYSMFKSKTKFPLHSAIKLKREDVVFLYLIEFGSELQMRINACDENNSLPLDLALATEQETLALTLLEHKADVNAKNTHGVSLLHSALKREDAAGALFLLSHKCDPNHALPDTFDSPLHRAVNHEVLIEVVRRLIDRGANINSQNKQSCTPMHAAVEAGNSLALEVLLMNQACPDIKSLEGLPPLWRALQRLSNEDNEDESMAAKIIESGADTALICGQSGGNTLLHLCATEADPKAGIFLLRRSTSASVNRTNSSGESPLHLAAQAGHAELVEQLLKHGANPDLQTESRATALHAAIDLGHVAVIRALLSVEGKRPHLDLKNSDGETALSLALSRNLHEIAVELLNGGADVNVCNANGFTLLHSAVMDGDSKGAIFLLNNAADMDMRTSAGETPLELAIKKGLSEVVDCLCRKGADMSASSSSDPPLWLALSLNDEEIASVLVRYGVDTDGWGGGPDGCRQTLLHRAIDENNESAACFLVRAGCDLNSPRKEGLDGSGGDEAYDLASPLHLCCQWGLEATAQALMEHGAKVNSRDVEGKTPLHVSIENGHSGLIDLLLSAPARTIDLLCRDKTGLSPLATAMAFKNNQAAQAILRLEPTAAEQYDTRGRNFLHTAILKNDLENVLFLLSINVDVNSRTQDSNLLSPLLLAVDIGNDMIVRNLILAGGTVDVANTSLQTCLHVAAENNFSSIAEILLSNGVDFAAVDNRGCNALHIAVKEGNLDVAKTLLTESQIDAEAFDNKGRNPLHTLAVFGKDNSASFLDLFLECMPAYPINKSDAEGNTPLLTAYMKGNGSLCRGLVKAGAILGCMNNSGVSIFNCQVATKQLLYRLLDFLSSEPKWGEGDLCEECGAKFGITTRKHHCRHCGRLLCNKCSDKDMPIVKYGLSKPVRVCDVCADVLTIGPGLAT